MTIKKDRCDYCGRETEDMYGEMGWIRFDTGMGAFDISISSGRGEDGCAKTRYKGNITQLDFCSRSCLEDYFKVLIT